jgi:hypothetical protein
MKSTKNGHVAGLYEEGVTIGVSMGKMAGQ